MRALAWFDLPVPALNNPPQAAAGRGTTMEPRTSRGALVDFPTGIIAALSAVVLIYFRINSAWLIFAGGLVGLVATRWLGL